MGTWTALARNIGDTTGEPFPVEAIQSLGGGCINSAFRMRGGGRTFFVKTNSADRLDMFEAEAEGLAAMAATATVRVPQPICCGIDGQHAYLVLENLALGGSAALDRFGERLAAMHRHTANRFGWHRDNTIGSTHQPNAWDDDWFRFWREKRLGFQLELAASNGFPRAAVQQGEQLLASFEGLFSGYRPEASLLHGDLWGGNYATTSDGAPVIFDPATYYGDREADIAMTELFGGFSGRFYAAYDAAWPRDAGYAVRRDFYNLYHVLNHFNLFGGGYGAQADRLIRRLLSELR